MTPRERVQTMASKLVNNLGKLGVRVAAATSDPGRQ